MSAAPKGNHDSRGAGSCQAAAGIRQGAEADGASPRTTKVPRLSKPLMTDSTECDRMFDKLKKDVKHRAAYRLVYENWGDSHDEILRTIEIQTGLKIGDRSRISHMKKRMTRWAKMNRPEEPAKEDKNTVELVLAKLERLYVGKGSLSSRQWNELAGTKKAPGDVRNEVYASLLESPENVKKACAAARKVIDDWRQQQRHIDHAHEVDG